MKKLFLILCVVTTSILADYVSTVTADGEVPIQSLSSNQEKLMESFKKDIQYFHERLVGLMNYVRKNKAFLIKSNVFEKRDIAYIEHKTLEGRSAYVVNGDTFITFNGEQIETIKFSTRKGTIDPRYLPEIFIREIENQFQSNNLNSIKLKVYHYPLAYKETNPIEVYELETVSEPLERLKLVNHYRENLRKLVRELENMVEHDRNRKNLAIWKALKEVGAN